MSNVTHKLSITFNILLLLVCCAVSTFAQPAQGAPANPSRQPGQERRRPTTDNFNRGAAEQKRPRSRSTQSASPSAIKASWATNRNRGYLAGAGPRPATRSRSNPTSRLVEEEC